MRIYYYSVKTEAVSIEELLFRFSKSQYDPVALLGRGYL